MTVQYNASETRRDADMAAQCPPPVSLETLEIIEQALGEMLSSLRQKAAPRGGQAAGEIEYESWRQLQH